MASTEEEYHELMNAEVFVEIDKLRDIAKHGVPDNVRGDVWMYLLGVQHSDKCKLLLVFYFFFSLLHFLFSLSFSSFFFSSLFSSSLSFLFSLFSFFNLSFSSFLFFSLFFSSLSFRFLLLEPLAPDKLIMLEIVKPFVENKKDLSVRGCFNEGRYSLPIILFFCLFAFFSAKEMSSAQARANEYKEFDKEYTDVSKRIKGEVSFSAVSFFHRLVATLLWPG